MYDQVLTNYGFSILLPQAQIAKAYTSKGLIYDKDYYTVSLIFPNIKQALAIIGFAFLFVLILVYILYRLIIFIKNYLLKLYKKIILVPIFDISVSYSNKDKNIAYEICGHLRKAGFSVWIENNGIDFDPGFPQEIIDQRKISKIFIGLMSLWMIL